MPVTRTLLGVAALAVSACGGLRGAALPTLTTAAAIHGLSPAQSKLRYPVRIRAVCVVCFPSWHGFFASDGATGVYVETKNQVLLNDRVHAGSIVEIEGVTGPGEFAPIVDQGVLRVLGEGKIPSARPVSLDRVSTGVEDGQWVELEGVVRSADISKGMLTFSLTSGRVQVDVITPDDGALRYLSLIDAKVRVRATAGPVFNRRRQLIGINLYTSSLREVRVLEAAPDPFALPVKAVREVFEYTPGASPDHRVRIRGVVTGRLGNAFFLTDGVQGASVVSNQKTVVAPGDIVDVAGFSATGDYTPTLHDAVFRKLGLRPAPAPRSITAKDALSGDFDGDLVRIDAGLIQRKRAAGEYTLVLDSAGVVFPAIFQSDGADAKFDDLRDGSRVQLTGICTITETLASRHFRLPKAFQILLRSPQDLVILEKPSWWTVGRILVLLGISTVSILFGILWVVSLKRRVWERTETIRATLEATADGILVVDSGGRIVAHNQKFETMWAVPESVMSRLTYLGLMDFVKPQLADPEAFTGQALVAEAKAKTDEEVALKDGRAFECHSEPQTVMGRNVGRVWGYRDVTGVRQRHRELQEMARLDSLTGIRNRRAIFEFLASELAREKVTGEPVTVIMADLDGFKAINDRCGHAAGDAVLKEAAQRLSACIRATDAIGRYGGEEFLIVLPGCDEQSGALRAEKFRSIVGNRPMYTELQEVGVTCSFGVACTNHGSSDMVSLLQDADEALYRAKQEGRNRVVMAEPGFIRMGSISGGRGDDSNLRVG
jgi:diguanylate cyclase (GGDEF)-like protein